MAKPHGMKPHSRGYRARLLALGSGCLLSACAVGPDFHRPAAPTASDYGKAPVSGESAALQTAQVPGGDAQRFVASMDIPGQWWALFQSDDLNQLVAAAIKGNPNMDAAKAALRQAHELYAAQRAAFFPTVDGNFSATPQKFPSA